MQTGKNSFVQILRNLSPIHWIFIVILLILPTAIIYRLAFPTPEYHPSTVNQIPKDEEQFLTTLSQYGHEFESTKDNEVKREQIKDLIRMHYQSPTMVDGWIATVKKVEKGKIILHGIAYYPDIEIYPNNTSNLAQINADNILTFSGRVEVEDLPGVFYNLWAPVLKVYDGNYTITGH